MRSTAPPLMPVFRSPLQARLLAILLLRPDEEHTLTDLARDAGAALSTVHAEVNRLVEARILAERTVGRSRLVRADPGSPAVRPLTDLVALTFGPSVVVAEEFGELTGVDRVVLYGSWAARYLGEAGPPPRDVDVLVVGKPDRAAVYEAADRAERRIGLPVHPVVASPTRFSSDDPLMRQIRSAPAVTVLER